MTYLSHEDLEKSSDIRVLPHGNYLSTHSNNDDISMAGPITPAHPGRACPIQKLLEDEFCRLVLRCLGKYSDDERSGSNCMPYNRYVVKIVKEVDSKGVRQPLRKKDGSINPWNYVELRPYFVLKSNAYRWSY